MGNSRCWTYVQLILWKIPHPIPYWLFQCIFAWYLCMLSFDHTFAFQPFFSLNDPPRQRIDEYISIYRLLYSIQHPFSFSLLPHSTENPLAYLHLQQFVTQKEGLFIAIWILCHSSVNGTVGMPVIRKEVDVYLIRSVQALDFWAYFCRVELHY